MKYNYQTSFIYHYKLAYTRQLKFYTIHAYYNEIKNACYRLGICLYWDHKKVEEKIKETFLSNMDIETKLEMTKYPISDLNSLLNKISATENIIIKNLSLSCTLERHKIPDHEYSKKKQKTRIIEINTMKNSFRIFFIP
ncbi:hypothetical protein DMUE_0687 [Dictyocoela muelleri]|nr:hypothetical protein DMUE_0687 [Dictyocoela muelleri]